MHDLRKISVMEDVQGENERIARRISHMLTHKKVFAINEMGAPGVGKTTALINIIERLKHFAPCVIEGDIESDIDTETLKKLGVPAYQINTFGACHLDAPLVAGAIQAIDFEQIRGSKEGVVLFIENVGNLVCPAEFSIGEHMKLLVCSITEGSDKPYKYPLAFEKADMFLLGKSDLLPYLDFDEAFFLKGLRALNLNAPLVSCSAKTGEGFDEAAKTLEEMARKTLTEHEHEHTHSH